MEKRKGLYEALRSMERTAEISAGNLRQCAFDLEEVASGVRWVQPGRACSLEMIARRLNGIADFLILEAQANDAKNVRGATKIALAILAASAVLLNGVGQGVGAELVGRAMGSSERAVEVVKECEATAIHAELELDRPETIDSLRREVHSLSAMMPWATDLPQIADWNGKSIDELSLRELREFVFDQAKTLDRIAGDDGSHDEQRDGAAAEAAVARMLIASIDEYARDQSESADP